jgi:hypothetical protein
MTKNMPKVHFGYMDIVDYALREALLKDRFNDAKTVISIQSHHGLIGIDETHIEMKVFLTVLPQKYVKFRFRI